MQQTNRIKNKDNISSSSSRISTSFSSSEISTNISIRSVPTTTSAESIPASTTNQHRHKNSISISVIVPESVAPVASPTT
jgi:hypothetical protein